MIYKELFELINDLSPEELELVNRSISNNSYLETNEIRLFNFLFKQVELPGLKEVSKAVYKKTSPPSYDSFKKLVYRAKNKVFEAVILCNDSYANFQKELNYTAKDTDIIKVIILRKAIVIQSFLEKRNHNFIKHLLDDIIQQSSKYEFYYLTVEYLQIKLSISNPNDGEVSFNKIKEQIAFYEDCRDSVNKANENYIKFTVFKNPYQNQIESEEEVVKNISILKESLKINKSDLVKYYLLFYEMNLHLIKEDFVTAKEKSIDLIQFVSEKNSVRSKERLWTVNAYLIKSHIYLKNYIEAIALLKKSQVHLEIGTRSYLVCREYEFLCNTYLKRYKQAEEILNIIFEDTAAYNLFEKEKLCIYKANLNFIKCEYKNVYDMLYERKETLKDVTGWEYNRRVLQLFINLFRGKEDEVIRDFECLKKQVKRNSAINKEYRGRDMIIFKIMRHICKKNYILSSEDIKLNNLMKSLSNFPWQPFSCELIPVDEIIKALLLKAEPDRDAVH